MPGPKVDYGEPRFNLDIKIDYPISWESEGNSALKEIYQKAIMWANGLLKHKYVTNKGYIRGVTYGESISDLPIMTATLNLNNNIYGLKDIVDMGELGKVSINYNDGSLDFISVESGKGLYIEGLKKAFDSQY